jgi:hypothetical protein
MLSLTSTKEGPSNLSAIPGESETVWPSERATDTLTIKEFRLMVASAQEKIAIQMFYMLVQLRIIFSKLH